MECRPHGDLPQALDDSSPFPHAFTLSFGDSELCRYWSYHTDLPSVQCHFQQTTTFSLYLTCCFLLFQPQLLCPLLQDIVSSSTLLHWLDWIGRFHTPYWHHVLTPIFAITWVYLWHCIYQKLSAYVSPWNSMFFCGLKSSLICFKQFLEHRKWWIIYTII